MTKEELYEYLKKWAVAHPDVKEVRDVHRGALVTTHAGAKYYIQVTILRGKF